MYSTKKSLFLTVFLALLLFIVCAPAWAAPFDFSAPENIVSTRCVDGSGSTNASCSHVFVPPTSTIESWEIPFRTFKSSNGVSPYWEPRQDANGFGSVGYHLMRTTDTGVSPLTSAKVAQTRQFSKNDYGTALSPISTNQIFSNRYEHQSPVANDGALLLTAADKKNQPSAWIWYSPRNFKTHNLLQAQEAERLTYWIKLESFREDFNPNNYPSDGSTNYFHVGTYNCVEKGGNTSSDSGCPNEGPGNNHFYHYLGYVSGAWIKTTLTKHPNHERGVGIPSYDPNVAKNATGFTGYWEDMNIFYMEVRAEQPASWPRSNFILDEMRFVDLQDHYEPNQNDSSVANSWLGYWRDEDKWKIGWSDLDTRACETCMSTHQIKWSESPITNANFANATPVTPLFYGSSQRNGSTLPGTIRKMWPNGVGYYTEFELPDSVEIKNKTIYFAIKNVSAQGANAGTLYPWNRADNKNAANTNIHTIEYRIGN